ncbi:glycosyl hydrolase family 43 [Actinopolyspora erythraea]|uniref:Glycosyl hydrolase family 43 n=1 Tax=Actinopolyspora erythraea TaxID=414996 RepID=A0A223RV20_9ACTN|nr:glycoside hydrolase family 43 protein [Actinopolyspora erythraea]ASU79732.1 glycosyl hydrolase family 43 [Actinopolyspora erythraea]
MPRRPLPTGFGAASSRAALALSLVLGGVSLAPLESGAASPPSTPPTGVNDTAGERRVAEAAAALRVPDAGDVRGDITLPRRGAHGTTVSWRSEESRVVNPAGEVNRPEHGADPISVELTATVRLGPHRAERRFRLTVPPLPERNPEKGYLFTYFTGAGTADGEQVHFAASRGDDALAWDELNGGEPVLTSTKGEGGVRDPFIVRSPEGDKFYLIATDLRMHGDGNWDEVQRHGSRHIEVWESTDLVHWSEQRHVRVAPDNAGNVWAPEAYYDESIGAYVVFWASKLYDADDPDHSEDTHNRMMYATTRDFHTFGEPRIWQDPGHSVIDSTVVSEDGTYYRFTKDERANSDAAPCDKYITEEKSPNLRSTDYTFVADCIGEAEGSEPGISRGEGPTVFESNSGDKWYMFIDEFGGRGYVPFETTDLDSGEWTMSENYDLPDSPRHGTVLPVTADELQRLRAEYGTGTSG